MDRSGSGARLRGPVQLQGFEDGERKDCLGTTEMSEEAAQGATGSPGKDRDPPPRHDGTEPEATFRQYEKEIRLW